MRQWANAWKSGRKVFTSKKSSTRSGTRNSLYLFLLILHRFTRLLTLDHQSKNELCYEDGAPVFGDTVKVEPADDGAYGDRFDPHSASNLNWREREEVSRSASEEEEEHFPDDVSPEDSGSEKEEARENGRRASGEQYRNLVSSPTLVSA